MTVTHVNPSARNQPVIQALLEAHPHDEHLMDIYETEEDPQAYM